MAYTKQNWQCGDEITAEKLNHMEDGISQSGGGTSEALIVRYGEDREIDGRVVPYLDTTFGDIVNAYLGGRSVLFRNEENDDNSYLDTVQSLDSYSIENNKQDEKCFGSLQFATDSFPVANITGDEATTLEELMLKYPHVYLD